MMLGSFAAFFGKRVCIGIRTTPAEGHEYCAATYDVDAFYTKHGFAVCMSRYYLDFSAFMEGRLPKVPLGVKEHGRCNTAWLVIDRHGLVTRYESYVSDGEDKSDYTNLPVTGRNNVIYHTHRGDLDVMTGFASVSSDEAKFEEMAVRRNLTEGCELLWFNLDEIVAELNKRFPIEEVV